MDSPLWNYHVKVPVDIATSFLDEGVKRVVCTYNDEVELQLAFISDGKGGFYLYINKEVRKKLGVDRGDKIQVELKKDESKYGLPLPPEFEELLKQDVEGEAYFEALTPGKQRNLLHLIGKPKGSDIRLKKALVVMAHLKKMGGKIDFKILNADFKEANSRF